MRLLSFLTLGLFSLLASAQVPQLDWRLEPQPPGRNGGSLVFMESLQATMLFGGAASSTPTYADTWLWRDGWRRVESPTRPSPRVGALVAYDSLRHRVLLFGGGSFTDTWSFDGTTWTQLSSQVAPPATPVARMAYDRTRDRMVLRTSLSPISSPGQVWEFDGTQWQIVPAPGEPFFGQWVYHPGVGELWVVAPSGVFAWNGTQWLPRGGPSSAANPTAAIYDAVGQRILLLPPSHLSAFPSPGPLAFAIHAFDGLQWSIAGFLPQAPSAELTMSYDSVADRLVGFERLSPVINGAANRTSGTWVLEHPLQPASSWERHSSGLPMGRQGGSLGYDAARRRLVVIGGEGDSGPTIHDCNGRDWSVRGVQGPSYAWAASAFDPQIGRLVFLGSSSLLSWMDPDFGVVTTGAGPSSRLQYGIAHDTLRQRTLVFSGQGAPNDLWSRNGQAWTQLSPAGPAPSARRRHGMCYDTARDRVVLFGGALASGFSGQTWEFDGTSWQLLSPVHSPSARAGHVLVYAPDLQRTILYGGFGPQDLRDTWLWDGVDWQQLVTTRSPDIGAGVCGAYDTDRKELVVFGGGVEFASAVRGEMWRLVDVSLSTWTASGGGCDSGNGILELTGSTPPSLGTSARFILQNTPVSFVALPIGFVGFDAQQWAGVPLPFSLASFGSPDCSIWADPSVPVPMLSFGSYAEGELVLPELPSAVGLTLHVQGVVWDFATGRVATANLLSARLGPR